MIPPDGICELVRRAQSGDRLAYADLLQRTGPDLEGFALRHGDLSSGVESVSDLTQQAALRFWEKFHQFQGADGGEPTAAMLHDWIQQLVRNLAANRRDARHAAKRRPDLPILRLGQPGLSDGQAGSAGLDPAGAGPTPSAAAAAAELDTRARAALASVPDPTDRRILELCFMEGLSLRAVAERLGLGYDKVRERYHAGLRFLERQLEGLL